MGIADLGAGFEEFFRLENGIDIYTGKPSKNGHEFGRQSSVGLSCPYGALTLGRQFDEVVVYIEPIMANGRGAAPICEIDDTANECTTGNSVKYMGRPPPISSSATTCTCGPSTGPLAMA